MTDSLKDREIILQREIPFSREQIWQAMTDHSHVNNWWGPDGFKNKNSTMEFKVGGQWRYDMLGPDGTRYPNHVVYKEITPPAKLVFDHGDQKSVWFETTITLEEKGGKTLVTLRQLFPSQKSRDEVVEKSGAIEGGKQHLSNLEAYIKENLA
jgi:uncharacterized protein YndB with AHSA1/START domain